MSVLHQILIISFLTISIKGTDVSIKEMEYFYKQICYNNTDYDLELPLRVGSWKIDRIGVNILDNTVSNLLIQIIRSYDIVAVETPGVTSETANTILSLINNAKTENAGDSLDKRSCGVYGIVVPVSDDVYVRNREYQKSRYMVFYRIDKASLNATFHHTMDEFNLFQEDAVIVYFNTPNSNVDKLPLILVKSSLENLSHEKYSLKKIYQGITQSFFELDGRDAIIIETFNPNSSGKENNNCLNPKVLHSEDGYLSLNVDIVTTWINHFHDRITVVGQTPWELAYLDSARAFQLNGSEFKMQELSDFPPSEILLKGKAKNLNIVPSLRVTVLLPGSRRNDTAQVFESCSQLKLIEKDLTQKLGNCSGDKHVNYVLDLLAYSENYTSIEICGDVIKSLQPDINNFRKAVGKCFGRPSFMFYDPNGASMLQFGYKKLPEIYRLVDAAHKAHPCVFSKELISVLKYKLRMGALRDASLHLESRKFKSLEFFCVGLMVCSMSAAMDLNIF